MVNEPKTVGFISLPKVAAYEAGSDPEEKDGEHDDDR